MTDFIVSSKDVDNLVRAINQHADKNALKRELYQGLNRATKPIRGEMKEVIPAALPTRGGLSGMVQGALRSNTRAKSGEWAGVSMYFRAGRHDIRTLTGRRLRHPVFGNRGAWVTQTEGVHPAVWSDQFELQKPEVQREIVAVLESVARKVTSI